MINASDVPADDSSPHSPWTDWRVWLFPGFLMLLIGVLGMGGEPWIEALRYDRAGIENGEWYRLITGNLVHLPGNTIEWRGWTFHCPERLPMLVWLRRSFFLFMGMSLGLYFFAPDMVWYVGLSGAMHGFFVLGLVPQAVKKDIVALGCVVYLLGKLGYELYAGAPVSDEAAIGGKVALESHLWGAVSGLAYGVVFQSFWKPEQWAFWKPAALPRT